MGNSNECELPVEGDSFDKCLHLDDTTNDFSSDDHGPSPTTNSCNILVDDNKCYGFFQKQNTAFPSSGNSDVSKIIQTALNEGNLKNQVQYTLLLVLLLSLIFISSYCILLFTARR